MPWYDRMPHEAKAEMRARWADSRRRGRSRFGRWLRGVIHATWRAGFAFAIGEALFVSRDPVRLVTVAAVGAGVGAFTGATAWGALRTIVIAAPAYAIAATTIAGARPAAPFAIVFASLCAAALCAASRMVHEDRMQDGAE